MIGALDDVRRRKSFGICAFRRPTSNNCFAVRQSYERGFRHIIVDDSPDLGQISSISLSSSTYYVDESKNDKWSDGDTVEWNWNQRRLRYTFRTADTFGAKELIKGLHRFQASSI